MFQNYEGGLFAIIKRRFLNLFHKFPRIIYFLIPNEFKKLYRMDYPYNRYNNSQIRKSYNYFEKYFSQSVLFTKVNDIQTFAIEKSINNNLQDDNCFIEFGVYRGKSANHFAKFLKNHKLYAFDSFEGLREDWKGRPDFVKGEFNLNKKIPKLEKNIIPIVGIFQNTLKKFIEEKKPKICFVHIDIDTYESTKYVLENIKNYLSKGSIIIFDELFNNPGWEHSELKALNEVFKENEYKYLAFNLKGEQVVIEII